MFLRALLVLAAISGLLLAACGPPDRATEEQICGPGGCDGCIGAACNGTDGGVR